MLQFDAWKKAVVAVTILFGVLYAAPNILGSGGGASFLPGSPINLGLDLQGGSHLLLRVDIEEVERERLSNLADGLRVEMRKNKVAFRNLDVVNTALTFGLRNVEDNDKVNSYISELYRDYDVIIEGLEWRLTLSEQGRIDVQTATVEQSIEIIRRRLDPDGTKEPIIQRQGLERILVQLPGVDDPERVKRLLGRTARLTFQLVDTRTTAQEARQSGRVPPGSVLLEGAKPEDPSYVVERRVMVSGDMLDQASASFDQQSRPAVTFQLNALGGKKFGRVTGENIGRPFAIVLDGKVVSAPVIQSQIFTNGQITGNFSVEETQELSLILRAGALPAPLIVLEERSVGPGLGADSIAAGKIAAIVGMVLVIVYMFVSYGLFGLFADIALCVNIILILAALSALQATLTLPGIAGIVLTMGMAVDANVLIFERIREEVKAGRSVRAAIEAGYDRAISTIIDSNLTTLFAALFLFIFGSGPIKGFAVTLSLGIITSMFTAILVTRLIITLYVNRTRPKLLSL
ncbi:MAG: protein translocase subunit SecD [Alphaproteobacteria bacterium]|nr:protein translocase subunit SecD [Alphaproteobacteria bacterium]